MAPASMRKEVGLPATVRVTLASVEVMRVGARGPGYLQSSAASARRLGRVTLASIEVMRVGAWGPGHLQSSAASPRRLGRAGRRTAARDQEGMSGSLEGGLGSRPSNVPLCHSWHMDLEWALALGIGGPSGLLCRI